MTADRSGIRARVAAATPGEWSSEWLSMDYDRDPHWMIDNEAGRSGDYQTPEVGMVHLEADADLIAHAPADLAALLDELDAKDAALARVRELVDNPPLFREWHVDKIRDALDGYGTSRRIEEAGGS